MANKRHVSVNGTVVVFIIALLLAIINITSLWREHSDCSAHGGKMVKGFSWNEYVCVDENR